MALKSSIKAIDMDFFDAASLGLAYQELNAEGLEANCFLLRIINDSNVDVSVSYDGTSDNEYVRAGETAQITAPSMFTQNNNVPTFPKGMKVYFQGNAGTGSIFVSGYYQPN